ncbi:MULTISPECIES: DUF998 domain-containing protein [Streptomyces]|uniref:DUF998 domain-containing protein n=2 Tax=Streptomyces TaxID=1883 RepID=A0ABU2RPJ0_9ACTN|nr:MULTISPECIES: DUF998 domain-containing protein [unclassified Streptomyces]MBK3593733.1 DUF998 domain-containing protein [Streptomyces sp. MBT51]MDT0429463.1 DUF998 domain-containing protein [Streptomyces sp. DSM 41770]HBF84301.1 DUF998 domain-containing protein [Streptomyces sp.]
MRSVPWWVLLSSACAPVLLVGGWTISAVLQGPGYDPASATISILAADGAHGYWVMTSALLGLGVCHVVTACGLRPAARAGRLALGGGGVTAMLLALFPAPSSGGSLDHGTVVAVGFCLLALWPVLAVRRGSGPLAQGGAAAPWGLRPGPSLVAAGLMWLGGAWFLLALFVHDTAGAAERVVTFEQSFWPLMVAVSCARGTGGEERPV